MNKFPKIMNSPQKIFVQNDEKIFSKPIDNLIIMVYNIGTVKVRNTKQRKKR